MNRHRDTRGAGFLYTEIRCSQGIHLAGQVKCWSRPGIEGHSQGGR